MVLSIFIGLAVGAIPQLGYCDTFRASLDSELHEIFQTSLFKRAMIRFNSGDVKGAREDFTEVFRQNPRDAYFLARDKSNRR
jgi:hypothetical protein